MCVHRQKGESEEQTVRQLLHSLRAETDEKERLQITLQEARARSAISSHTLSETQLKVFQLLLLYAHMCVFAELQSWRTDWNTLTAAHRRLSPVQLKSM